MLIIGSAPSSGSTFLQTLLERHPLISAYTPELNLFCKEQAYTKYEEIRKKIWVYLFVGLTSNPIYENRAFLTGLDKIDISKKQTIRIIRKSKDFSNFCRALQKKITKNNTGSIWIEKTPENIFFANKFLKTYPDGKVIHIIRNPRDSILSMMKRGFSIQKSSEHWLAAVSAAQKINNKLEVKYEDLVLYTDRELKKICAYLDIPYKKEYFNTQKHMHKIAKEKKGLNTWNMRPTNKPSDHSLYKYKKKNINIDYVFETKLTKRFSKFLGVKTYSIKELASMYGYEVPKIEKKELAPTQIEEDIKHKIIRKILREPEPFVRTKSPKILNSIEFKS